MNFSLAMFRIRRCFNSMLWLVITERSVPIPAAVGFDGLAMKQHPEQKRWNFGIKSFRPDIIPNVALNFISHNMKSQLSFSASTVAVGPYDVIRYHYRNHMEPKWSSIHSEERQKKVVATKQLNKQTENMLTLKHEILSGKRHAALASTVDEVMG